MATTPHARGRRALRFVRLASLAESPMPQPAAPDLPDELVPGSIDPWQVAPVRPDTPHVRSLRFLDLAGEFATAILIIAGGVLAYGWLPST